MYRQFMFLAVQPVPNCVPDSWRKVFQTQQKFGALDDLAHEQIPAKTGMNPNERFAAGIPINDVRQKTVKLFAGRYCSFRNQLAKDSHPILARAWDVGPASSSRPGRTIPSFFILNCRVDRFIPNRAAAPLSPPTTHLTSFKVRRM
jgi:hypothetical protein